MKITSLRLYAILFCVTLAVSYMPTTSIQAQGPTATPVPAPNALLIYDKTTVALINTATTPISLAGLTFWRSGGAVQFSVAGLGDSLLPGHCIQLWTNAVSFVGKPAECTARDRYASTNNKQTYFWVPDYDNEPFRPQIHGSALTICNASAGRCTFYMPQGDEVNNPWPVLDPATQKPMPAGMEVAFDANQLWIVNSAPDTILPMNGLRMFYPAGGTIKVWGPAQGPWDETNWDHQGLATGQCILLYSDQTKTMPLLPCTLVGKILQPDQPWLLKFDVMGPREERRSNCGGDQPPAGPTLCVVAG